LTELKATTANESQEFDFSMWGGPSSGDGPTTTFAGMIDMDNYFQGETPADKNEGKAPQYSARMSATDREYLDAVDRGDMETAQRMVDEAAREAGYTIKTKHATPFTFSEFKREMISDSDPDTNVKGFHVSNNADEFSAYVSGGKDRGARGKAKALTLYVKPGRRIDRRKAERMIRDGEHEDRFPVGYDTVVFSDTVPWTEDLQETFDRYGKVKVGGYRFEKAKHKAVNVKDEVFEVESVDLFYRDQPSSQGAITGYETLEEAMNMVFGEQHYVIKNPDQIKSADPVTHDDNGDVIPLSERFGLKNKDIRYSSTPRIAPGTGLGLGDIRAIFKAYPSGISANDKSVWVQLPSGTLRIKTVQQITGDMAAFEVAHKRKLKPGEILAGAYLDSKIEIQADFGDKYTLHHELEHFAEDIGLLTNGEIFAINRALRESGKEASAEERAEWVEENLFKRDLDRKTRLGRIIQKVEDFIDSLVNLFTRTTGGVLRAFESGRVFSREGAGPARTKLPQYSARVVQSGNPEIDAKADALLKKLLAVFPKGVPDAKKTLRALNKYDDLVQTLQDGKIDIYEKQKALEEHVKEELPMEDRGRALHLIKFISKPVTSAGREKMLQRAVTRVNQIHEKTQKARAIKEIRKLLKPNKRGHKKGVAPHEGLSLEGQEVIKEIRAAVRMPDASAEIEELMRTLDNDYAASLSGRSEMVDETETARRLAILQTFSGLDAKSAEDLELARDMLADLIKTGKLELNERIKAEREERAQLREMALDTITGGKGLKSVSVERLESAEKKRNLWGRVKEKLRSFDDMHQSYEFLLDKLSRFDTSSNTLESGLTERYANMTFDATENEQAGVQAQQNLLAAKLAEIWGVSGPKLGRILRENSTLQKRTGVTQAGERGRTGIPLSQNQAYKLWQMFQQPSIQEEMRSQGYDEQTLAELERFIDPKVKEWAQWQIDGFYHDYRTGVNEVFQDLFYTKMPEIENYSPISRVYFGETEDDAMLSSSGFFASVVPGAVYSRKKNARDFNIIDGDTVLLKHIVDMEHFKAWGKPMREIRSVLGSEPVQRAIKQYHGRTANRVLQQFHNDFASGGKNYGQSLQLLDTIRKNFTLAVLGVNPVIFVKQLTAIPAYAMDIPVKDFLEGFTYALTHPAEAHKTLMESKTMQARYKVGFERDIILNMQRDVPTTITGQINVRDLLMLATKMGDKLAIVAGGWSVYSYHLKRLKAKGMTHDAAHKEALHQFGRATRRSQQAGDTIDLGYVQRSWGSIGKLFTMFMTQPTSYYRNTSAGLRNLAAKRGGANIKRVVVSWVLLNMVFQLAADGFDWEPEKQARAALLGPLNGLFIVRDLVGTMSAALFEGVTYWTAGAPPPLTTANLGARAMMRVHKMIKEGLTDEDMSNTLMELAEFTGNLTGVPVGPTRRIASGISDAMTGETEHPLRRSIGYTENALTEED
jgi:hypothetical protein